MDLENAVLLLGEEVQNLKFQIHLKCDWNITTFCVIPQENNQSEYSWEKVRWHLQGHTADNHTLDIKKLQAKKSLACSMLLLDYYQVQIHFKE